MDTKTFIRTLIAMKIAKRKKCCPGSGRIGEIQAEIWVLKDLLNVDVDLMSEASWAEFWEELEVK